MQVFLETERLVLRRFTTAFLGYCQRYQAYGPFGSASGIASM
jgi:hypothetical protein